MKNKLAILLIAATVAGCAVPVRQGDGQYGVQQQKATMVINGIPLTPVANGRNAFPRGKFNGFPIVTQQSDLAALDALARSYAKASWEAAAKQDWETFEVNRHLGARIVEYRVHGKIATTDFVKSITASGDGSGVLAPGATVFLKGFTRDGTATAPVRMSSVEAITERLASNESAVFTPNWADAPRVAQLSALSGILDTGAALLGTAAKLGGATAAPQTQAAAQQKAEVEAARVPVGTVFTAKDAAGNSYLVERTPTGFIYGNNGQRPARVPVGKLGCIPDMPAPDADRRAAAPLVMAMQAARHEVYWQALSAHATKILASTAAPNLLKMSATFPVRYFDAEGRVATTDAAAKEGAAAYKVRKAYRAALSMADYSAHKNTPFESECFSVLRGDTYATDYRGEYAEILRHKCLKGHTEIYGQDFYVRDGKTMQTFASLMKDQAIADALKNFDAAADLAELAAGFVPGLGTVDAGAKCLTGTSLTNYTASGFATNNEQYRSFVSDLMPPIDTPSAWSKTLTCASAVPGVGVAVKVAARAGKALGGSYRAWRATDRALAVAGKLDFFDSSVLSVGNFSALAGANGFAETSIAAGKKLYDVAQAISTGNDATGATTTLLN